MAHSASSDWKPTRDALERARRDLAELARSAPPPPAPPPPPPEAAEALNDPRRRLRQYALVKEIGHGASGRIWKAWDAALGRWVAVKRLREDAPEEFRARFHREAQSAARARHPHLVTVHEVGEADGRPFLVMEFVDGRPFDPAAGPLDACVRLLAAAARAVDAAHAAGVIHRDLKPANLLVDARGEPRVVDFGVARLADAVSPLTQTGDAIGTPAYMAPEQVDGSPGQAGPWTDVYALGAMLYEVLTRRPPHIATGVGGLYQKILHEDPRVPRGPRQLAAVCLKALEKDPRRRYSSAGSLADDLDRFLAGEPVRARPPGFLFNLRRFVRRRRAVLAAAAIALAIAAAVSLTLLGRQQAEIEKSRNRLIVQMRSTAAAAQDAALALRRAGDLEGMQRHVAEVENACGQVLAETPSLAEPHYRLGRMLRARMRFDEALAEQEKALAVDPRYAPALYERVVLSAAAVRRSIQSILLDEAAESDDPSDNGPDDAEDDALERVRRRLEGDLAALLTRPEGIREWELDCARGLEAWIGRSLPVARERLEAAIRQAPLEESYETLALFDWKQERHADAVKRLTAALDRDRGYVPYLETRGLVRAFQARSRTMPPPEADALYEASVADFDAALRLDPGYGNLLATRGRIRELWGVHRRKRGMDPTALFQAAVEDLGQDLARDPGRSGTWLHRGITHLRWAGLKSAGAAGREEHVKAAVADFSEAARINPGHYAAWAMRGRARLMQAARETAAGPEGAAPLIEAGLSDMTRAIECRPTRALLWQARADARARHAEFLQRRGADAKAAWTGALADYEETARLNPRLADAARDGIGRCRKALGAGP
jgi:serine/threonine-protein kinase